MDLIKVTKAPNGQIVVSARELHQFLRIGRDFTNWLKDRIEKYGLEDGLDFTPILAKSTGGRPQTDYALTVETAKELSMVENNDKGKEARRYFIECERKMLAATPPAPVLSTLDLMELGMRQMREHETRLNVMEQKVLLIEAKTTTRPNYFTVVGYATLQGISVNLNMAARIGKEATKLCAERGLLTDEIPDPRFGKVKMYPESVLYDVFQKPI